MVVSSTSHRIFFCWHPRNIDKFLFKRKRIKREKEIEIEKQKEIPPPPSAGPDPAHLSFPPPRARALPLPRGPRSPPPARSPPSLTSRPHPSAHAPLPRDRLPHRHPDPACQPLLPLACDQATGVGHRPPHLLAINALTSSVGAMRPRSLCPSHPFTPACPSRPVAILRHHHRHGELAGAHRSSSLPPSQPPIKGLPRAPCSTTPGLSHSTSLPRAQSSSAPSSLPSPVSSVLLSLVAYDQISLALKVRLSVASLAHTFSSPIAPSGLAGDFTAASARHPPWTGHPRHPPVKLTPPT
jgi:hypothetical protein